MEYVQVTKKFVREAYDAACTEWKEKIKVEFPNLFCLSPDTVKDLPEYNAYMNTTSSSRVVFSGNTIEISLPIANKEWTISAWKLAIAICEKWPDCYPRHEDSYSSKVITIKSYHI